MRIAIVNDLRMAVEILRRVIASVPEYEVAWVGRLRGRDHLRVVEGGKNAVKTSPI